MIDVAKALVTMKHKMPESSECVDCLYPIVIFMFCGAILSEWLIEVIATQLSFGELLLISFRVFACCSSSLCSFLCHQCRCDFVYFVSLCFDISVWLSTHFAK